MTKKEIILENVNLHYSSLAYREYSIKSYVLKLLKRPSQRARVNDIHALKNINFEVREGERVGLIGHNGAGKSTFLKMVAGLYPISSGVRRVTGKSRALFELSLGFEVEATGRENIFYRGLLMGLRPADIRKKMQDIIDFVDIGPFIDYPIKTYSAGMLVRLAFAISTTVKGDILLLDEIIAAGDSNFLEKAKNRISNLILDAEILIFASHDFSALTSFCNRGIVLNEGNILYDGSIDEAISAYKKQIETTRNEVICN